MHVIFTRCSNGNVQTWFSFKPHKPKPEENICAYSIFRLTCRIACFQLNLQFPKLVTCSHHPIIIDIYFNQLINLLQYLPSEKLLNISQMKHPQICTPDFKDIFCMFSNMFTITSWSSPRSSFWCPVVALSWMGAKLHLCWKRRILCLGRVDQWGCKLHITTVAYHVKPKPH